MQTQLDAALAHDDAALRATLAPGSIALTPTARKADVVSSMDFLHRESSVDTERATITKLVADSTPDALWFYAEVTADYVLGDDVEAQRWTDTIRIVELVTSSEGWRSVASSFTAPRTPQSSAANDEIDGATTADGPLTKLVGTGEALARRMTSSSLLVGYQKEQDVVGPDAARASLAAWNLEPVSPFKRAREVTTASWAFSQLNADHVDGKRALRLAVQVFAVPAGDGNWNVVLAQYIAQ